MDGKNLTELYEKFKSTERRRLLRVICNQPNSHLHSIDSSAKNPRTVNHKITKFDLNFLLNAVKNEESMTVNDKTADNQHFFRSFIVERNQAFRTNKLEAVKTKENGPPAPGIPAIPYIGLKGISKVKNDRKILVKTNRPPTLIPCTSIGQKVLQLLPSDSLANEPDRPDVSLLTSESPNSADSNSATFSETDSKAQIDAYFEAKTLELMASDFGETNCSIFQLECTSAPKHPSRHSIPQLPFILEEFSDDLDPKEFFKQNYTSYSSFLTEIRSLSHLEYLVGMFHFTGSSGKTYNSMSFVLKLGDTVSKQIFIPFSIAYLLMHCTTAVRLCFAHSMLLDILRNKKPIGSHASFRFCSNHLSILSKEEDASSVSSVTSRRTLTRKSMFSMLKTTIAVEDEQETEDAPEKPEMLASGPPAVFKGIAEMPVPQADPMMLKTSLMALKPANSDEIQQKSASFCESESSSGSDSHSNSSLDEEEYMTKNKFEILYSEVTFKFQRLKLSVVEPYLLNQGIRQPLTREQVYSILGNRDFVSV